MSVPPFDRPTALARLGDEHFDVLVVGGGITGAGVALDAATRGSAHRARRAATTSPRARRRSRRSSCTAGSATSSRAKSASSTRRSPSASACARPRRTSCGCCRSCIPIFTKDGLHHPKIARALGTAMWMYDLTGGVRIGKLHKRLTQGRGARPHADAAGRTARRRRTSTTTPRPTTPGSRSRSPGPPPTTARRSPTTRRSSARRRTPTAR